MAELEQMIREIVGDSWSKLNQFQEERIQKVTDKIRELAREAVHEDFTRMTTELATLRERVAALEAERAETAAERIEPNF